MYVRGCRSWLLLLLAAGFAPRVQAQALDGVPPPLAPWVSWVRASVEDSACAVRDGETLCFWPGPLALALSANDGSFRFDVRLDRRQLVPLPGGEGAWPLSVRVAGKPMPVVTQQSVPSLDLPAGEHRVEGRFVWAHLPDQLAVPPIFGQLQVTLQGRAVSHPKRSDSGSVWLQSGVDGAQTGPSQLELIVARKLTDAVPLTIETRIRIRAAGEPREINLGNVLITGSVPLAIESELPVRLDPSGELRLQVRAGSYALRVVARTSGAVHELASRARPAPWPEHEAWVFEPDAKLRQLRLSGAPSVDPARLELDADLRGLPTFLMSADSKVTLDELRRGEPEPPPNQLNLRRTMWLDQDGRGYTVHDELAGELHSGFRLELHEGQLGSAAQLDQDQLITQRTAAGPLGVELRDVHVALRADSRLEQHVTSLPAVGWSEDVRQLAVTLNLPPGYALWAVQGVDHVERTWLGDWNLLGFFFVLVVAFGTVGVAGRWAGVLAFVALAFSYQEDDAPSTVWLWLLVFAALLRVLPRGRLWQATRAGLVLALLSWLITWVPFAGRSVREAIYPQLAAQQASDESGASFDLRTAEPVSAPAPAESAAGAVVADEDMAMKEEAPAPMGRGRAAKRGVSDGENANLAYAPSQKARLQQDPEAVVQTGPGLPNWRFQSWQLTWSGPVAQGHRFELILIPPLLNRLLSVLRVLLSALLLALIIRAAGALREKGAASPLAAAMILLILPMTAVTSAALPSAHAQFPEQSLLEQLRLRTLKPPACRPSCVNVADLDVQLGPNGLLLRAEVHAQDLSSVRVPGPLALWAAERVRIDGAEAHGIAHHDGFLHVRVTPGVHVLEIQGTLPPEDTLTLRLGDVPAHVSVHVVEGYEVSGVREDGTSDGAIELRRLLRDAQPTAVSLPPWFVVTRTFEFANEFRVLTVVERQTPSGAPQLLHLPLLPNESVHDARVQVSEHKALLALGPDDRRFQFESTLSQTPQLTLKAVPHDAYSERWQFLCGSMWQCQAAGLVPVSHEAEGRWQPQYSPWPGEHLQLTLSKPTAAPGQTTTIDSVQLTVKPGVRATDAELHVSMRSSRGGDHKLYLPAEARVRSFSVAGTRRSTQREGGAYGFSVLPGRSEIAVELELPEGAQTLFTVPAIKLDSKARNARVVVEQPQDRWLLWASGPAWGPAILFWGYLVLSLFIALALGRLRVTPLRTLDWLLLAAGLTQVDSIEALCVVTFFFGMAARARTLDLAPLRHNLMQCLTVMWVLAASAALFDAVRSGLLVQPDMQVMGAGSMGNTLRWYVDDSAPELPRPTLLSVPLWSYRVLMLAWSLWLARRLLSWAPWVFHAFTAGGLWKKRIKTPKPAPPPPAAAADVTEAPTT